MAGLLSLLAGGARAGLAADTGAMQGQQVKRDREQQDLLSQLARDRQAKLDAQESERMGLLNALTQAQTQRALEPPTLAPRNTDPLSPEGIAAAVDRERQLQAVRPKPPTAPVRGTPEYNQMLIDEAKARNSVAPARTTLPTQGERKAAALYASGKQGYDTLEKLLGGDDPTTPEVEHGKAKPVPGWLAQQTQKLGFGAGNVMTNADVRQMRQAALMLSDAWLRYTSGAAVPETEVERFAESFIPRAGDDPGTLAQKKEARRVVIEALRSGAGRAMDPSVQGQQPDEEDGLDAAIDAVLGRRR